MLENLSSDGIGIRYRPYQPLRQISFTSYPSHSVSSPVLKPQSSQLSITTAVLLHEVVESWLKIMRGTWGYPKHPHNLEKTIKRIMTWNHQNFENMGVSKNNGTPKSSILIGFSIISHPFWGFSPYFWRATHIQIFFWAKSFPPRDEMLVTVSVVSTCGFITNRGGWGEHQVKDGFLMRCE